MKKFLKISVLSVLIFSVFVSVFSCSAQNDPEITEAAKILIENSYEVNEIFFGKGISPDEESKKLAEASQSTDVDIEIPAYAAVNYSCGFENTDMLKEKALEVYSAEYCDIIFESAFKGVKNAVGNVVYYPRYIDDEHGELNVRCDVEETGLELSRTYDTDSIKIKKKGNGFALIEVTSLVDGEISDKITLKMVMEDGNWRLDSPTY